MTRKLVGLVSIGVVAVVAWVGQSGAGAADGRFGPNTTTTTSTTTTIPPGGGPGGSRPRFPIGPIQPLPNAAPEAQSPGVVPAAVAPAAGGGVLPGAAAPAAVFNEAPAGTTEAANALSAQPSFTG
jgi:hypothetical protein